MYCLIRSCNMLGCVLPQTQHRSSVLDMPFHEASNAVKSQVLTKTPPYGCQETTTMLRKDVSLLFATWQQNADDGNKEAIHELALDVVCLMSERCSPIVFCGVSRAFHLVFSCS